MRRRKAIALAVGMLVLALSCCCCFGGDWQDWEDFEDWEDWGMLSFQPLIVESIVSGAVAPLVLLVGQ